MSVMGTIQPAEVSRSTAEMIGRLALFLDLPKETTERLYRNVELVEDYFRVRGSLTLAATRTLLQEGVAQDFAPKDLPVYVFPSNELPKFADVFLNSGQDKQGWIISHFIPVQNELHPHQMPIFIEKKGDRLVCTIFDRRINWDKIRNSLMQAFLPHKQHITFYLSTERRQYDWSTCSLLSLDDLKKLNEMDREKLYAFFEEHYSSKEIPKDKSWTLVVSDHLPPLFMELVQSPDDFENYRKWAKDSQVDPGMLERIQSIVARHITGVKERFNNAIIERFRHVATQIIVPKILSGIHPAGCSHELSGNPSQ